MGSREIRLPPLDLRMTSKPIAVESVFAPLRGLMAWQVRADEHGCVMMEFGEPHLDIREPMHAPDDSSPKVKRMLVRRVVKVVGDWHLWIESCNWTLKSANGETSSQGETGNFWQHWMDDVTGQRMISAESPTPGALRLSFDMGAVLEAKPDPRGDLDSWSLHPWQGATACCNAAGTISIEAT